jgi:hypothetical protein
MKKLIVKSFQNLNNSGGGMYGIRKNTTQKRSRFLTTTFEDLNRITIIKSDKQTYYKKNHSNPKMYLKKADNNAFVSKLQTKHFKYRKKKLAIFYKKKNIITNLSPNHWGSRQLITID